MDSERNFGNGNSSDIGVTLSVINSADSRWWSVTLDGVDLCSGVRPGSLGVWHSRLAASENVGRIRQMGSWCNSRDGDVSDTGAAI